MKEQSPISVGELAEWIIDHRSGSAFEGDSFEDLCAGIQEDIKNHNLLYVLDNNAGTLIGVVSYMPDRTNKVLFVRNILITKHTALVIFAQHFSQHFFCYNIVANRYNENIMYNTSRLIGHLLKMKGGG